MRTAVLGGGIAGLTAAYRLAKRGSDVTLFEATDKRGGLGGWFEYDGYRLDKWYHVLLDSDDYLLGLIDELGLRDRVDWAETTMGFIVNNKHYPFNTAVDLLKFGALRPLDRIRTGMAALYITKLLRNGKPLDNEPAHSWLVRIFGRRVYESIWEPLLIAKFGDMRNRVPAYWVWNTLNREKNGSQEVKGYVRGGNAVIVDRLVEEIEKAGGRIRLSTPVTSISSNADGATLDVADEAVHFDNVVCTLPFSRLSKIADKALLSKIPQSSIDYQGVVNVMLVTRERLSKHYWTAVVRSDLPFQGVVETTHVVRPDSIGNRHLLYLMNYCRPDSHLYKRSDSDSRCDRRARSALSRFQGRLCRGRLRLPRAVCRARLAVRLSERTTDVASDEHARVSRNDGAGVSDGHVVEHERQTRGRRDLGDAGRGFDGCIRVNGRGGAGQCRGIHRQRRRNRADRMKRIASDSSVRPLWRTTVATALRGGRQ